MIVHRILSVLFFGFAPVALGLHFVQPNAQWPAGILLMLAFASTVVAQCRILPAQNVFAATLSITILAGLILTLGAATNIPFGPIAYTDTGGERIGLLPWWLPLVWVVVILNCRGVARLILRPWRKIRTYGFRVIGLTCVLAILLDLGLEPFATRLNHFWVWQPTSFTSSWFGAPWINSFGWLVTILLILAFTTPWLINKRPVKRPPDYHPLGIWLVLNLFLAGTCAFQASLWPAAILILVVSVVTTSLALRYARW